MRTTPQQDKEFTDLLADEIFYAFDAGFVLDWVKDNFAPEDIFNEAELAYWAQNNGFVEEK